MTTVADRRAPAENGLWVFILGDLTLFGAFFSTFSWIRWQDRDLFARSADQLSQTIGLVNTVLLLTSSLAVVWAVHAFRSGRSAPAGTFVGAAIGCSAMFVALKVTEYVGVLSADLALAGNYFFTFYFVLTAIHLLHVLVGTGLLTAVRARARTGQSWKASRTFVEGVAVYWHMVDLLWIVLFALLYLASGR